ncbi:conserved membrane hypothetical protein [Nostocoides japonicum T1-X7]|uniref:ABC-type transport system involved in multi-copper enzyme maturation, permease component n=1 Tax=Nostocoides japonicum T1-X7 TaxID=1194083 RepID=A0A077M203_9MICO|nr:ABC transporter permease [Tetrasphaera japonica]CCH78190.1 conserved membrane hypothetical protein [Tetrasphaera japonica T1-X7]
MSAHGVWTVAALELRQRARTSRWPAVLAVWFVVIAGVTVLTWLAINSSSNDVLAGPTLYDVTTFLVLALGMLVVPSLTATSINGDREQGVLATLQTTLLTPADIVVGKLLASWLVSLVFLAVSLPFLVWAWVSGGISIGSVLASLAVLALVLAVVCAIGLMFSTLTARPVASAVLTYLAMAALTFGTVIVFVLSFFLVDSREQVRYYGVPDSWWEQHQSVTPDDASSEPTVADCRHLTRETEVIHTERIWWLLPLNPFVVVADAAPGRDVRQTTSSGGFTPMRYISIGARAARAGADTRERQECYVGSNAPEEEEPLQSGPVWPFGLGFLLVVGAGASAVAIRRTRTPVRRLPNGTRIA